MKDALRFIAFCLHVFMMPIVGLALCSVWYNAGVVVLLVWGFAFHLYECPRRGPISARRSRPSA